MWFISSLKQPDILKVTLAYHKAAIYAMYTTTSTMGFFGGFYIIES